MADIDGRDALEMILDRMDDKIESAARLTRERDEARLALTTALRDVENLKRDLSYERGRPKAPTPAGEPNDEIPF